jgi:hypothetical protein
MLEITQGAIIQNFSRIWLVLHCLLPRTWADTRELKMHQMCDADATKNSR